MTPDWNEVWSGAMVDVTQRNCWHHILILSEKCTPFWWGITHWMLYYSGNMAEYPGESVKNKFFKD